MPEAKKLTTIGTKVPIELAEKFARIAKEDNKTVSSLLKEVINEEIQKRIRIVERDTFQYNPESHEVVWYGIIEGTGEKWVICDGLDMDTVKDWISQLNNCMTEHQESRTKVRKKRN